MNHDKRNINKKVAYSLTVALIATIFLGFYIYKWEYRKPILEIHFFSLNRGRSVFIRTPGNKTILVGGGQNSEVIREITKVNPFYSRSIDYVIIPSATQTQIGGLLEILDRYSVGEIIMPKITATSTVLMQLLNKVHKKKIHIEKVERGDEIKIGDGVNDGLNRDLKISILFPIRDFKYNKTSLPELGLEIVYKNTNAYLLGNLSKTIQKYIFRNMELNSSKKDSENIIEFYNSAIESKVSAELLEKINPKFIFSTREATIHFVSDGEGWKKIK